MPIKPENRGRYPANWPEIRARILARASNCCEQCHVANGDVITRGTGKDAGTFQRFVGDGEVFDAINGKVLGVCKASEYSSNGHWTKVVLTIAHLDHVPEHCDDTEHHRANAAATRRSRKAIGDLFEVARAGEAS